VRCCMQVRFSACSRETVSSSSTYIVLDVNLEADHHRAYADPASEQLTPSEWK